MVDAYALIDRIDKMDRNACDDLLLTEMSRWKKQIEELQALSVLADNFVLKGMVAELTNEIASIDAALLNKRKAEGFTEFERELLLERKLMYTNFVHRFDANHQLEEIERQIDENL